MKKPLIGINPEKTDSVYFTLVLFFAIFSYTGNNLNKLNSISDNFLLPGYPVYLLLIVGILTMFAALFGIYKGYWSATESGFALGKGFRIIMIITTLVVMGVTYQIHQNLLFDVFYHIFPITIFITGVQIVIIALLVNRTEKIFGNTNMATVIGILLAAVIYIYTCVPNIRPLGTGLKLMLALFVLFKPSRSLIGLVFLGVLAYANVNYVLSIWIMVLLVYLTIALIGRFIEGINAAQSS